MKSFAKPYFNQRTTLVIKGIALVLMFIHHFFTFPDWWIDGIDYPNIQKMSTYLCWPLKICVPIFCFITGYVYVFNKRKNFKYFNPFFIIKKPGDPTYSTKKVWKI